MTILICFGTRPEYIKVKSLIDNIPHVKTCFTGQHKDLLKNINVDYTFLNIVNKKNLFLRLKQRKSLNRYDKFNMSFYNKVQKGFIKLSKVFKINPRKY